MDYEKYINEIFQIISALHNYHKENEIHLTLKGEIFVLLSLACRGGSALPGELADNTGVSTARIAAILKSMEKKGLLKREVDVNDRRKILVTLTPEGKAVALEKKAHIFEFWKKLMDALGEEDVQNAIRILKKVHAFTENTDFCFKNM